MLKLIKRFIQNSFFLIGLVIFILAFEYVISDINPVNSYGVFYQNDFSKTVHFHPEKPWRNVFYGSSIVAGSFVEEISETDYINLGISYGKISDLEQMLTKEILKVEDNIVIAMNFFTFMDELPTDPAYIWHKKPYEPYLYFYRGTISNYIKKTLNEMRSNQPINNVPDWVYQKELYYGNLSEEELNEKKKKYKELYGDLSIDDFNNNINDLQTVIDYCKENDIRLRCIWMPWNPVDTPFNYVEEVKSKVNKIFTDNQIEVIDWTEKYEAHFFHDLGHLNWEEGAPKFTKEIDRWLKK